jgi:hypothetical protein
MRTTGKYETLQFGKTYHIFNKANGIEKLFLNRSDYLYFLKKIRAFSYSLDRCFSLLPNS